jgi:hypothetical protein
MEIPKERRWIPASVTRTFLARASWTPRVALLLSLLFCHLGVEDYILDSQDGCHYHPESKQRKHFMCHTSHAKVSSRCLIWGGGGGGGLINVNWFQHLQLTQLVSIALESSSLLMVIMGKTCFHRTSILPPCYNYIQLAATSKSVTEKTCPVCINKSFEVKGHSSIPFHCSIDSTDCREQESLNSLQVITSNHDLIWWCGLVGLMGVSLTRHFQWTSSYKILTISGTKGWFSVPG